MNRTQWGTYLTGKQTLRPVMVDVDDVGHEARTLAYGYTPSRDTWHAYVCDALIHVVTYSNDSAVSHIYGRALPAQDLRPLKRAYPDATEFAFANLMRDLGHALTFTGDVNEDRPERPLTDGYIGRTHLNLY